MSIDICKSCDNFVDTDDGAEYVPVHKYRDVCFCPDCFMVLQDEARCEKIIQLL